MIPVVGQRVIRSMFFVAKIISALAAQRLFNDDRNDMYEIFK